MLSNKALFYLFFFFFKVALPAMAWLQIDDLVCHCQSSIISGLAWAWEAEHIQRFREREREGEGGCLQHHNQLFLSELWVFVLGPLKFNTCLMSFLFLFFFYLKTGNRNNLPALKVKTLFSFQLYKVFLITAIYITSAELVWWRVFTPDVSWSGQTDCRFSGSII